MIDNNADKQPEHENRDYWRANLRLMSGLLLIWFLVSFGCGILWVDYLNQWHFFGFKLGFGSLSRDLLWSSLS